MNWLTVLIMNLRTRELRGKPLTRGLLKDMQSLLVEAALKAIFFIATMAMVGLVMWAFGYEVTW